MIAEENMTEDKMIAITREIFEENGFSIEDQSALKDMDSLQYISILVSIEDRFNIELPDSMLARNVFEDMSGFFYLLGWLLGLHELK